MDGFALKCVKEIPSLSCEQRWGGAAGIQYCCCQRPALQRSSGHASVPRGDMAEPHHERAGVHIPWKKQPEPATRHPAAVRVGKKRRKDHRNGELARNEGKKGEPDFRHVKTLSELKRNCSGPCTEGHICSIGT